MERDETIDELDFLSGPGWLVLAERFFVWPGVSRMRFTLAREAGSGRFHAYACTGGFAGERRWICYWAESFSAAAEAEAELIARAEPYAADDERWRECSTDPRCVKKYRMKATVNHE